MKRKNHTEKMISAIILIWGVFLCSCQNSLENRSQTSSSSTFTSIPSKTVSPSSTVTNLPTNTLTPAITQTLTLTPELTIWPTSTNTIKPHGFEQGTYIGFPKFYLLESRWYIGSKHNQETGEWLVVDRFGYETYINIVEKTDLYTTFTLYRDSWESIYHITVTNGSLIMLGFGKPDGESAITVMFSPSTNEFLEISFSVEEQTVDIPITVFFIFMFWDSAEVKTFNLIEVEDNTWHPDTSMSTNLRDISYVLPNRQGYRWDEELPTLKVEIEQIED